MSVMSSSLQWISAEKLLYFPLPVPLLLLLLLLLLLSLLISFCVHACKDNK